MIGASANLCVAGIGERNGVPFRFVTFTLYAFPMMLVSHRHRAPLRLVALFLDGHSLLYGPALEFEFRGRNIGSRCTCLIQISVSFREMSLNLAR